MMTPQDIREKTFEKAVFGGYEMAAVDDCLEDIHEDYSALFKENATLKAKLKILASKIEEYRENEDALRLTLLSAQKMSSQIEAEAKVKSTRLLAEAEAKSAALVRDAQFEIANEEARLVEAKRSTAQYMESMRNLCVKQLDFLDHLGEMTIAQPPVPTRSKAEDAVRSIEENIAKAAAARGVELTISKEIDRLETNGNQPTRSYTPINTKGTGIGELRFGEK